MKIGFIGQINESGHSYVTKAFVDAIKDEHEYDILASRSVKDDRVLTDGIWEGYNVTPIDCEYQKIGKNLEEVFEWLNEEEIDVVFTNEWYDWQFVRRLKSEGLKLVGYVDWFSEDWIPMFEKFYDETIICGEHTYDEFFLNDNANFVPWGVDLELFKPRDGDKDLFFHTAGWGGINYRKGTPEAIEAFHKIWQDSDSDMFLHTQTPVFDMPTRDRIKEMRNNGLNVHLGSVSHPGLYHKGKVLVAPTKLEGLGLYIPEALACGLPVITTDAYPMKQFVTHGENGLLVDVEDKSKREDGYFFPEHYVDEKDLERKMRLVSEGKHDIEEMSENAREFMEQNHSFRNHFKPEVLKVIDKL